jgi:protein TonB
LIENANQAMAQRQLNAATQLLTEARRLGFEGVELTTAEERLRGARTPPAMPTAAIPAPMPKLIRAAAPKYPETAARANVQGWVDVGFGVDSTGDVVNATVVASDPPGTYSSQFERAAVAAIRQYKFEARADADPNVRRVQRIQFRLQ